MWRADLGQIERIDPYCDPLGTANLGHQLGRSAHDKVHGFRHFAPENTSDTYAGGIRRLSLTEVYQTDWAQGAVPQVNETSKT